MKNLLVALAADVLAVVILTKLQCRVLKKHRAAGWQAGWNAHRRFVDLWEAGQRQCLTTSSRE